MKVKEAKLKAQADWVTFIKDGAQTPKAWTFVRVVYTQLIDDGLPVLEGFPYAFAET